jgi:hypothetical protein
MNTMVLSEKPKLHSGHIMTVTQQRVNQPALCRTSRLSETTGTSDPVAVGTPESQAGLQTA